MTRPWFAGRLGFPMAFVYPPRYKGAAESLVTAATRCCPDQDGVEMAEAAVARAADDCMRALAQKLGDKQYMFGRHPSALDAVVLSHLAPIVKVPWPGANRIRQAMANYPNLERYVSRVLNAYFAKECVQHARKSEDVGKGEEDREDKSAKTPAEQREEMWATVENIVSVTTAVSLMFLYGYGTGLFENMLSKLNHYS